MQKADQSRLLVIWALSTTQRPHCNKHYLWAKMTTKDQRLLIDKNVLTNPSLSLFSLFTMAVNSDPIFITEAMLWYLLHNSQHKPTPLIFLAFSVTWSECLNAAFREEYHWRTLIFSYKCLSRVTPEWCYGVFIIKHIRWVTNLVGQIFWHL